MQPKYPPERKGNKTSTSTPLTLAELQDRFMSAILRGSDEILKFIPANSRTGSETLLSVYRNAYLLRLIGVVASDHEYLKAYLGDERFNSMAQAYVRAHPSHSPNARWFAQCLPDFLMSVSPYNARRELAEIAAIERALNLAFDARDEAVIDLDLLRTFPPEQWGELVFRPQGSAQRLDLRTNAYDIWSALKMRSPSPQAEYLQEPQSFLVWREDVIPKIRAIGREEAMMWDEAVKGVPFSALCELLAVFGNSEEAALRAAQYLQSWLSGGLLSGVTASRVSAASV
jgi:hypothetical protein